MKTFKCQLCDYKTDKQQKLSKHTSFVHKLKFPNYLIQVKYNGVNPLCECGCKEKTKYSPENGDFYKFIRGHQSRLEGHWGDLNNPNRVNKIISTRKAKFASGEYDHIKNAVRNRDNIELGKKISKSTKGIPKPKPEGFGVGRIQSEKTKQKMSNSAIQRIIKTGKVKRSLLEIKFELFFRLLNINFQHSYYINTKENHFIYDFYLPKHNILIEVDGDFWHCNPNTKYASPECKTQEINILNDQQKNKWAQDNGFKLLRFWEKDINENPQQIIEILKKELVHI
jgi:very-short-patch-repair endonuclease